MLGHFKVVLKLEIWSGSAGKIGKSISAKIHKFFVFSELTLQTLIHCFNFCATRTLFSSTVSYMYISYVNCAIDRMYINGMYIDKLS